MINPIHALESEFRTYSSELEHECAEYMFYSTFHPTDDLLWQHGFFTDLLEELDDKNRRYLDIIGESNSPYFEFDNARAKTLFILKIISEELESRGEDLTSLL